MNDIKQAIKRALRRKGCKKRTGRDLGIACVLAWLCLFFTGCSSIIYNGNLKIEPYEPETVPPVRDEPDYKPEIQTFIQDGKPAFYILDGHEPDPNEMTGFKLLDLIDGTTTIYAYTTPYRGSGDSGLPGGQPTGKAVFKEKLEPEENLEADSEKFTEEMLNWDEEEIAKHFSKDSSKSKPMVTVLMAYDTESETYQVFFCKVSKPTEGSSGDLASMLAAQTEAGVTANKAGENYFLYHAGIGYVFSKEGRLLTEQNLTEVLNENILRYKAGNKNSVTISDVIMDVDQRIYVPMVIEEADIGTYEDLTEEDLAAADGKIRKVICCCFHLNAGKNNEPPVFFKSLNENAEKQETLWCESAEEGEGRLSIEQVKELYPDQYGAFFLNQALALQLCGFSTNTHQLVLWSFGKKENPTLIEPYNVYQFKEPLSVVMAYNPNIKKYYYIKNPQEMKINYSDYKDSFQHYLGILFYYGVSGDWLDSVEPLKKTIRRTYTTTETETGEDGTVTEVTVEHEEEAQITVEYQLYMKEGTELFSSVDWWTSYITAPGASGLIHYGTNENEEKSFFIYNFTEQNTAQASGSGGKNLAQKQFLGENLNGYAISAGSIVLPDGECVMLFTSKGIAILKLRIGQDQKFKGMEQYFIPYTSLDFRKHTNETPDQYGTHNLSFNGEMILFFSLYNGIVMIHPDTLEASQLDTGAYYAAFLQDSGNYSVIGFRAPENVAKCTAADLPKARIYSIELNTKESALQIVKGKLEQDPSLRDEIASGKQGNELIEKWKLSAYQKEISAYFNSLREEKKRQEQGMKEFFRLTGLKESQEIKTELLNCRYPSSIEELIVTYIRKDKLVDEAENKSQYAILSELKRRRRLSNEEWNARIQYILSQIQAGTDES